MDDLDPIELMIYAIIFIISMMLVTHLVGCASPRVAVKPSTCKHFNGIDFADCEKIGDL